MREIWWRFFVLVGFLAGVVQGEQLKPLGCMHNVKMSRAIFTWTAGQLEDDITPLGCQIACMSFFDARLTVVGMTEGGLCLCGGNDFQPEALLPEAQWATECSDLCPDGINSCGGPYAAISVYRAFNFTTLEGPMEFRPLQEDQQLYLGSPVDLAFSVGMAECDSGNCDLSERDVDNYMLHPPIKLTIDYGDGSKPSSWRSADGATDNAARNKRDAGSGSGSGDFGPASGSGDEQPVSASGSGDESSASGSGEIESGSGTEEIPLGPGYSGERDIWSHVYTAPGTYPVTLTMHNEVDLSIRLITLPLVINDPVKQATNEVHLVCPLRVDPFDTFQCEITLQRGTEAKLSFRMEDEFVDNRVDVRLNNLILPQAFFESDQGINLDSLLPNDNCNTYLEEGIVVGKISNENARIAAISYVAITQGTFVIDALKPICGEGLVYCPLTSLCESHCTTTLTSLVKSRECISPFGQQESYCSIEKTCLDDFQCPADFKEAQVGRPPESYNSTELARINIKDINELVTIVFSNEAVTEDVIISEEALLGELQAQTLIAIRCFDPASCPRLATVERGDFDSMLGASLSYNNGLYANIIEGRNLPQQCKAAVSMLLTEERTVHLGKELLCDRITQKSLYVTVDGPDEGLALESSFKVSCSPDGIHFTDLSAEHPSNLITNDPGYYITWRPPPEGATRSMRVNEDGSVDTLYIYNAQVSVPLNEEITFHIEVMPGSLLKTQLEASKTCPGLPINADLGDVAVMREGGSGDCSFPFAFNGTKYLGCATIEGIEQPICATQVHEETFQAQVMAACSDLCPFQVPNLNESSLGFSLELRRTFENVGQEEQVTLLLQSLTNASQLALITWEVLVAQPLLASDWTISYPSEIKEFEPFVLQLKAMPNVALASKPILTLMNVDTNETLWFHSVDLDKESSMELLDCEQSPACLEELELSDVGIRENTISGPNGEVNSVFGQNSIAISIPFFSKTKGRHTFAVNLYNGISNIAIAADNTTVMQTVQRIAPRPEGFGQIVDMELKFWSSEQTTVYREILPPFEFKLSYYQTISSGNEELRQCELEEGSWFMPARLKPYFDLSVADGTVERIEFVAVPLDSSVVMPAPCIVDFPLDMDENDEKLNFIFEHCDPLPEALYDAKFRICNKLEGCLETQRPINLEVMAPAGPVTLMDDGMIVDYNEPKTIVMSVESFGVHTCLELDLGDDSAKIYYGNLETCRLVDSALEQYDILRLEEQLTRTHIYRNRGNYEVRAQIFDRRQNSLALLMVPVFDLPCPMPLLMISNAHISIDEFVPRVTRAKPVLADVNVDVDCPVPFTSFWTIFRIETQINALGQLEEGVAIEVDLEEHSTALSNTALRLPPKVLEIGLYKLVYTLKFEMERDEDDFDSESPYFSAFTYVEISKSDLVAIMIQGSISKIRIGYDELLELEAADRSYDPDDISNKNFNYTWYCRVVEPEKEELEMDQKQIYPLLQPLNKQLYIPAPSEPLLVFNGQGCFGSGPGQLRSRRGNLALNTASFVSFGMTFELMLVLSSDDGRRTKAKLEVEVTRLSVPKIDIECVTRCVPVPDGVLINDNDRIALRGICVDNCGLQQDYQFNIELDNEQELKEWYCESPPISMDSGSDGASSLPPGCLYIYGDGSDRRTDVRQLALSPLFFKAQSSKIEAFNLELEVTTKTEDGPFMVETSGSSELRLIINKPPEGGQCYVEIEKSDNNWEKTTTGRAAVDQFRIGCSGYRDPENLGITQYVFTLTEEVDGKEVVHRLHAGIGSVIETVLPPGQFLLKAEIEDNLGGIAENIIEKRLVLVVPDEEDYNELNIDELISEATELNDQVLLSQLSLVHSLMQKRACYLRADCALANLFDFDEINLDNMTDSQLEIFNEFVRNQSHSNVEILQKLRDTMTYNTMEELMMGASVLKNVVASSNNALQIANTLPREGREAAVDSLYNMSVAFDNLGDVRNLEQLKQFTNEVTGAAGAILKNVDHILSTKSIPLVDMDNVFDLEYDTFIDGEPLPLDPWVAAEKNALHVTRVEAIEQSEKLLDLIDSVTQNVVKNLVGGEEIRTSSEQGVDVIIAKVSGDRMVGRDMDGDGIRETPLSYYIDESMGSVHFPLGFCPMPNNDGNEQNGDLTVMGHITQGYCSDYWGIVIKEWDTVTRKYVDSAQLNLNPVTKQLDVSIHSNLGDALDLVNIAQNVDLVIERMIDNGPQHVNFDDETTSIVNVSTRLSTLLNTGLPPIIYHELIINQTYSTLNIQVRPVSNMRNFFIFVAHERLPLPEKCDFVFYISNGDTDNNEDDKFKWKIENDRLDWFIPAELISNRTGRFYVGLTSSKEDFGRKIDCNANKVLKREDLDFDWGLNVYELRVYVGGGYFFNTTTSEWEGRGLTVYNSTNIISTIGTSHLTSFASGFLPLKTELDFEFIYAQASFQDENTALAALITILAAITILLILAIVLDLFENNGNSIFMRDNEMRARYLYEIVFETGFLPSHGCSADIHFVLTGSEDNTGVRIVDKKHHFRSKSADSFVIGVHEPLGKLEHLRVWSHSNALSDRHAWFLNGIKVNDIQENQQTLFVADTWLALDRGKTSDEALFYASDIEKSTNPGETADFRLRCGLNHHSNNDHVFFAPFLKAKNQNKRFSRVQRVLALLALLSSLLASSIMYYVLNEERVSKVDLEVLHLNFDWHEIKVGAIVAAASSVLTCVIVLCFRRASLLSKKPNRVDIAIQKAVSRNAFDPGSYREKRRSSSPSACSLPSIFVILGYLMVAALVGWAIWASFISAEKLSNDQMRQFSRAFMSAIFISVFVVEPIKVVLLALWRAVFCSLDQLIAFDFGQVDEAPPTLYYQPGATLADARPKRRRLPMDEGHEAYLRHRKTAEYEMSNVFRSLFTYCLSLAILLIICYGQRDNNAFASKSALETAVVHGGLNCEVRDTDHPDYRLCNSESVPNKALNLYQVKDANDFWFWFEQTLMNNVRAQRWYNGLAPYGWRGYLDDRVHRLLGFAQVRQVRQRFGTCKTAKAVREAIERCTGSGGLDTEDSNDWCVQWRPTTWPNCSRRSHYNYESSEDLQSGLVEAAVRSYGGGGYVFRLTGLISELESDIDLLKNEAWINNRTRAVIVEFSVYNAQVNLFAFVTCVAEFVGGGVQASHRIEVFRLTPSQDNQTFIINAITEVLFILSTLILLVTIILEYRRSSNYFASFWNLVDLAMLVLKISAIILYVTRAIVAGEVARIVEASKGNDYVSLKLAADLDAFYTNILAFLLFLATIKICKLLSFQSAFMQMAATLRLCFAGMASFIVEFGIVFVAFSSLFFFVLRRDLADFRDFKSTLENVMAMSIGKFNFGDIRATDELAAWLFFLFSVAVNVVLINMMLAIINMAFEQIKASRDEYKTKYDLPKFLVKTSLEMTGIKRAKPIKTIYRGQNNKNNNNNVSTKGSGTKDVGEMLNRQTRAILARLELESRSREKEMKNVEQKLRIDDNNDNNNKDDSRFLADAGFDALFLSPPK